MGRHHGPQRNLLRVVQCPALTTTFWFEAQHNQTIPVLLLFSRQFSALVMLLITKTKTPCREISNFRVATAKLIEKKTNARFTCQF